METMYIASTLRILALCTSFVNSKLKNYLCKKLMDVLGMLIHPEEYKCENRITHVNNMKDNRR